MVNFSITLNSFSKVEPLENTVKSLVELGIRFIEVPGDPSNIFLKTNLELFHTYDLSVIGVTGIWTGSKNSTSPILLTQDEQILNYSKKYVKECIKICNFFGGSTFNLCLLSDYNLIMDENHEMLQNRDKKKLLKRIFPVLKELTQFSKDFGVCLLLEPLNRYSTPFCSSSEDALFVSSNIQDDNFCILLDTYHMNIEERNFSYSITKTKNFLKFIHLADNNRKMPGAGHINFNSIFKTLKQIQYTNYVGLEPIVSRNYISEISNGLRFLYRLSDKYTI